MRKRNFKLLFLAALFFGIFGLAKTSQAATINASSCSLADVTAAYNTASAGDTVAIPSGECTWTNQIILSKSVVLKGAGIDKTIINHNYECSETYIDNCALIKIAPPADLAIQVTGIYFKIANNLNGSHAAIAIIGNNQGNYALSKIRVDHNKIEKGSDQIFVKRWVEGLIDNNIFLNGNIAVMIIGDSNYSWGRPIEAGTAHSLFIEDNTFTVDNNIERAPNEQVYHQGGGRSVIRYNTINGTQYTAGNTLFVDSHGNWGSPDGLGYRGQPIIEIYNNNVDVYQSYRFMYIRGGSSLIYNNSMTTVRSAGNTIMLSEEESWQTALLNPLKTIWPADDQINNTFIWDNTLNGNIITSIKLGNANDLTFIQKDRDYFMHAPQATGGQETLSDGGSPYYRRTNTMTFSGSETNAYYPYTPYTYPHPLTIIADATPPSAPTGLSVN